MFNRWLDVVRAEVSGERALDFVRAIAGHHRIQASPGYDAAARWLVGELARYGLEYTVEEVPADGRTTRLGCVMPEGWECEAASATLVTSSGEEPLADFGREPLSLIQRSAPGAGCFPLVALADGTHSQDYDGIDVRGRVVLTDGAVQRVHQLAVIERGAAGILSDGRRLVPPARTREMDRDSLAYTSFWWAGDQPRGWGFVLSPARGEQLRRSLAGGEQPELEVAIRSRRFASVIPLVTAVLPGTLPGEILVTAHLCHPKPGANDNASGCAAALESALALGALARSGVLGPERRSIRWLWMPEFTGTYAWLGQDERRARQTVAALNLDMVGEDQIQCASVQLIEEAPHFAASFADELLAHIRRATLDRAGVATREVPYSGGSDHAVWADPVIGVPCPVLIQWPDRYYHSSLDSLERCDPASLAHAARIAATYAATLAHPDRELVSGLLGMVERGARRRLRSALDAERGGRAVRAARTCGQLMLASIPRVVSQLGATHEAVQALAHGLPAAADAIEGVYEAEIMPAAGDLRGSAAPPEDPRVPLRRQRSPLLLMDPLQEGWGALTAQERERFAVLDGEVEGGSTALDLAWFACDGRRSVDEIAECVRDEGPAIATRHVTELFELAARLGASAW